MNVFFEYVNSLSRIDLMVYIYYKENLIASYDCEDCNIDYDGNEINICDDLDRVNVNIPSGFVIIEEYEIDGAKTWDFVNGDLKITVLDAQNAYLF